MSKKHPIQLSDHFTYARLFRFVLPSIVMMVFTSIYGVVDGLFVSNFAGKTAFASINLIMPFLVILGALGFMLGTGGTALVSRVLGEGDKERANKYFSMITLFGILLGVILTVVGVLAMRPMAILLGATEAMVDDCVLYGRIVVCFLTSFMLQNMFQSFLIAAEQPKFGLLITFAAGVTNMVLDALFVGVFRWGIAGAAIATGISQTVGGVVPLMYFLFSKSSPLRLRWTKFEVQPLLQSCANGSSELMSNISGSLIGMLYNAQLMRFLGEDGVATYGVLMYVQFIFVAIDIGYSIGCAPIISYHYGAQNHPELRNLLMKGLKVMGILGIVMTIAAISLSGTLANIFVCPIFIDILLYLNWIPLFERFSTGLAALLIGMELLALGTWMYMKSTLGSGPRDALMVVLARKTHRTVGLCRAAVEVVIVWIGWQLGGQVGIGTIVAAVGVGSLFNLNFALLRFNPALLHQENLPETLQRFRERKTIA